MRGSGGAGPELVGFEGRVEPPNHPSHKRLGGAVLAGEGVQLGISRSACTQHSACRPTLNCPASSLSTTASCRKPCACTAPQSAPSVATWTGSGVTFNPSEPSRLRWAVQFDDQGFGHAMRAHTREGDVVEHEVGMAGVQQAKEIQPAFRFRRAEGGEVVIADLCANAIPGLMPRAGIVNRDPLRRSQSGVQNLPVPGEERVLLLGERPLYLPFGDRYPDRAQLGCQTR